MQLQASTETIRKQKQIRPKGASGGFDCFEFWANVISESYHYTICLKLKKLNLLIKAIDNVCEDVIYINNNPYHASPMGCAPWWVFLIKNYFFFDRRFGYYSVFYRYST